MIELLKNIWLIILQIIDTIFQTQLIDHPLMSLFGMMSIVATVLLSIRFWNDR